MDSLQDLTRKADALLAEMKQVPGCYSNANRSLIEALALGVKGLADSLKTLSPDGPSMLQCKECRVQETLVRFISMAPLADLADCGHSWQLYDRPPVLQLEPPVDWAERSEYALKHFGETVAAELNHRLRYWHGCLGAMQSPWNWHHCHVIDLDATPIRCSCGAVDTWLDEPDTPTYTGIMVPKKAPTHTAIQSQDLEAERPWGQPKNFDDTPPDFDWIPSGER